MSKILVPDFQVGIVQSYGADAIDFGATQPTFEFRNVIDTKSDNYTYIRNIGDQPIIIKTSGLSSLSTLFPNANCGWYLEYGPEAFYTGSGVNYLRRRDSSDGTTYNTLDVYQYYGDYRGTASNDTDVMLSGSLSIDFDRKRTLFITEGVDTSTYKMIFFGTNSSTGNGYDIKLYQSMVGVVFDLPDGYLVEQRSYSVREEGSDIYNKHYGALDRSYFSGKVGRDFALEFDSLNKTDAVIVMNIFRYSYGCLPVLFVENSSDTSTWRRIIMTDLSYEEPEACMYKISINCKEVF